MSRRQSVGRQTIAYLLADERAGVRALGRRYLEACRARERERTRLRRLLTFEAECRGDRTPVAGIDEAGVSPIAGPVVAGAVVLPDGWIVERLDDSKRLDPPTRERLDREIRSAAIAVGVGVVSQETIDRINIYQASLLAMRRALDDLGLAVRFALIDGRPPRSFPVAHRAVIGGDGKVRSIAAASIVAKVARDRILIEADQRWPAYGFARHKGYMTPEHIEALRQHGLCPIHRLSFPRVWEEADAMGERYREIESLLTRADSVASLEAAEFALDAARATLHAAEERLLQRRLEEQREALASLLLEGVDLV